MSRYLAVNVTLICNAEAQAATVMEVLSRTMTGLAFQTGVYGSIGINQGDDDGGDQ